MNLPPDCFSKSQIPGALSIGAERFYTLIDVFPMPPPTGTYIGGKPAKKRFPYWDRATLVEWLRDAENQAAITK